MLVNQIHMANIYLQTVKDLESAFGWGLWPFHTNRSGITLDLENCWRQIACPVLLTPLKTDQCLRNAKAATTSSTTQTRNQHSFLLSMTMGHSPNVTARKAANPMALVSCLRSMDCIFGSRDVFLRCPTDLCWLRTPQRNREYFTECLVPKADRGQMGPIASWSWWICFEGLIKRRDIYSLYHNPQSHCDNPTIK